MPPALRSDRLRFPARHVLLFVGAIVVPCGALIATGARMLSQDCELADTREAAERRQAAESAGRELLAKLDLLRAREERAFLTWRRDPATGYADPATALAAPITHGEIELPWRDRGALRPQGSGFARLLAAGQRFENLDRQYVRAVAVYDSAARIAPDSQGSAYAQLLAARAEAATEQTRRWTRLRKVSALSFGLRDEYGVPFALYAHRRLVDEAAATDTSFSRRLERELLPARDLSPTACSLARSILTVPGVAARSDAIADRCAELERATDVADQWKAASARDDSVWSLDQSRTLLYSVTASGLTVLSLDRVVRSLTQGGLSVRVVAGGERGEVLSPKLPGLRAVPLASASTPTARWKVNRNFYVAALGFVLIAGLTVAVLFWRDVQRDIRLAEMRARFVAGVSHELKTPLTAIRMYAETLRAGRPRDPIAREEYLDTIVAESERLSRLLDSVLDFASIDRGTKNYAMCCSSMTMSYW